MDGQGKSGGKTKSYPETRKAKPPSAYRSLGPGTCARHRMKGHLYPK